MWGQRKSRPFFTAFNHLSCWENAKRGKLCRCKNPPKVDSWRSRRRILRLDIPTLTSYMQEHDGKCLVDGENLLNSSLAYSLSRGVRLQTFTAVQVISEKRVWVRRGATDLLFTFYYIAKGKEVEVGPIRLAHNRPHQKLFFSLCISGLFAFFFLFVHVWVWVVNWRCCPAEPPPKKFTERTKKGQESLSVWRFQGRSVF